MELYPILDCGGRVNEGLWYVISPSNALQVLGGVGSKLCSDVEECAVYITGGAQPDQTFGNVYKLCLNTLNLTKLSSELTPRYEHGAAIYTASSGAGGRAGDSRELLVFGGADTQGNRSDAQILDTNTDRIVSGDVPLSGGGPSPRTIHNTARYQDSTCNHGNQDSTCNHGNAPDEVYVWCGGAQGSQPVPDTHLHVLNLRTKRWRALQSVGTVPSARHGHVICAVTSSGDKAQIVVHGGMSGADVFGDLYTADIEQTDSTELKERTCNWQKLELTSRLQPAARAAHSSAPYNNYMYIFGGFTGQAVLDDLWRFDIDTLTWTEIRVSEPRPHPRLDQTICVARLPYSDSSESEVRKMGAPSSSQNIQDITSLLHESADDNALPSSDAELPPVAGYQDILVLFGGMDTQGTIFNDLYAIKL